MAEKVGIVGHGTYIPRYRMTVEEIEKVWHNRDVRDLRERFLSNEIAVPSPDEDTITMAIEASRRALNMAGVDASKVGGLYMGSCTHPYVSKASSTIVSEAIGTGNELMCADIQFAGKSGTAAMQICMAQVKAEMIQYGLAIGSDVLGSRIQPSDFFEYHGSAGAAALLIGVDNLVAEIEDTYSCTSDCTDFFRLDGDRYIRYGGRASDVAGVGYETHVVTASQGLMKKLGYEPKDFQYAVFHQPYGSRPYAVGATIGFRREQVLPGNVGEQIGDCGAASSMIGLCAVLDIAKPGDRILLTSYGFGAGSDSFSIVAEKEIEKKRASSLTVKSQIDQVQFIDYASYIKFERKYVREYQAE